MVKNEGSLENTVKVRVLEVDDAIEVDKHQKENVAYVLVKEVVKKEEESAEINAALADYQNCVI